MKQRTLSSIVLASLCLLGISLLAFVPSFRGGNEAESREAARLSALRQVVPLTDSLSMQVVDTWLYPATDRIELLRIRVSYLGGDPNEGYHMRAEIGRSVEDASFSRLKQWQVGIVGAPGEPKYAAKVWEFQNFPRDGSPITVRLYLRPKDGGPEVMRHFTVPDNHLLTPNGEVRRPEATWASAVK